MARSSARWRWLALVIVHALGCRGEQKAKAPPAPVRVAPAVSEELVGPPLPQTVMHTVRARETLWDIARKYGVKADSIARANGLGRQAAARLSPGMQLRVFNPQNGVVASAQATPATPRVARVPVPVVAKQPGAAYHQLRPGESLWTLSRTYDVPLETLMERNGLSDDQLAGLRVGHPILIPGVAQSAIQSAVTKPKAGFTHVVAQGETVWDIARRYGVGVGELMAANALDASGVARIRDGTRLLVPGVERESGGSLRRSVSDRERRAQTVASRLGLGTLQAAGLLLHGRVEPRWIAAAGDPKHLPGTLRWPVARGEFVRGFGSGQGGYHKAMDIRGDLGWNVRAAAAGVVGYAGNQVPGFGNMVMLIHSGGWVTLYGHNSVNFVSAGQTVPRGGILAEVGSTGRSQGPHVHFELIYAGNNCDPATLFRPGVQHRKGIARLDYTTWRLPDKRPASVQCAKRQKHPPALEVTAENPERDATPAATETIPESEAKPEEP